MRFLWRVTIAALAVLLSAPLAWAGPYVGDFPDDATVYCYWTSNGADGASITRSTNGTISVYIDDSLTQTTTGVTDTEDMGADAVTGVHKVKIATTDSFYTTGSEFSVILSGATIDTKSVNAHICSFSIERTGGALALMKSVISGSAEVRANVLEWNTASIATPNVSGVPIVDTKYSGGTLGSHLEPMTIGGIAVVKDSTGIILTVPIRASTTGAPLTGLTSASSGLTGEYCRTDQGNATCTALTIVSATRGTFTSSGFVEKDTTAGQYEFMPPNAAFATGADRVTFTLSGVTGMAPTIINVDLVDVGLSSLSTNVASILDDTGTSGVVVAAASKSAVGTFRKNTGSQRTHPFYMRSTTDPQDGKTGLTVTLKVSKDGAAFATIAGSVTEISDGWYYATLSADDLNCDSCAYKATGSGAVPAGFYIFPAP